jgi:hypothetical protein
MFETLDYDRQVQAVGNLLIACQRVYIRRSTSVISIIFSACQLL